MISTTTHHVIDEAGVQAVLDAAEQHALQNGHRVVIAVVEHAGRADRQLARRDRQGTDGRDLRPAQPRA
jgi:uncharacterized protein GlcG (DUF336 family)